MWTSFMCVSMLFDTAWGIITSVAQMLHTLLQVLQQIRGQEDVEMEFQDIVMQTREANAIKHPLKALFKPCYRPQLVISTTIAIVQQLTGVRPAHCSASHRKMIRRHPIAAAALNLSFPSLEAIVRI